MKLSDFAKVLSDLGILHHANILNDMEITNVTNKTSEVTEGCVFCAIKGSKFDGHDFLPDAWKGGADAVIVHRDFNGDLSFYTNVLQVTDSYKAWAVLCQVHFGSPAERMHLHAVTGTNGKTSIAILLRYLLDSAIGGKNALLTTIFTDTCSGNCSESVNTMPDAWNLQKLFAEANKNQAQNLVMECSSHGLSQSRCGSAKFDSAIFTNLTGDHLDYHKTMENYYQTKKRLFTEFASETMIAVINTDDAYGIRLYRELAESNPGLRRFAVSTHNDAADYFIDHIELSADGSLFTLTSRFGKQAFNIPLIGLHNIYNFVSAFAAAVEYGCPFDKLVEASKTAPAAQGRLEHITTTKGVHVYIDYAHTDDAIVRVTTALNAIKQPENRLITVFGCGGDRDRTKRPRMGKAAAENSDLIIVTSDNPRTEDPSAIIAEIIPGVPKGTPCQVEPDRAKAIALALNTAKRNDLVLIAGKGHENYQDICGVKHHFSDRETVLSLVGK